MRIVLNHDLKRIKNGWSATWSHLTAHGYSEEVAEANLVRTVRFFFAPFRRTGILDVELERLGLRPLKEGEEVQERELILSLEPEGDGVS